jgi:monovalent cation:H+ antiporter-2, CPA2 family
LSKTRYSRILLFFGIAGVVVPLLQRLRMSPVLAYLLCGVVIGPYGLAAMADTYPWLSAVTIKELNTVQMLGELGIITLMFMIGLELSLGRLKELRRFIFGLGSAQILLTALVIFLIASWFDNALEAAILLGASFALSSTAIVMKLLEERHLSNRPVGVLCFSILLMQDLAVVPILVLATSFTGAADESISMTLLTSLGIGACTVLAMMMLGKRILAPLLQSVSTSRNAEWLAAFIVFIVIACAAITEAAGLSLALGAFLAGLLIAETEFKHEVEVIVSPLKGLLLGIFFLSVGMMINVEEILRQPFLLAISVVGIFTLKAAIIFPLCLWFKVPHRQAAEVSVYLAQPGEFALLILGVAMAGNLRACLKRLVAFEPAILVMVWNDILPQRSQ